MKIYKEKKEGKLREASKFFLLFCFCASCFEYIDETKSGTQEYFPMCMCVCAPTYTHI